VDALLDSRSQIFARSDGELGIMASNRFFAFVPGGQSWKEGGSVPAKVFNPFGRRYFTPEGVVLHNFFPYSRRELLGFWNDGFRIDTLLEQDLGPPSSQGSGSLGRQANTNRWEWPPDFRFDLIETCIIAQSNSLWILAPRKVWRPFGMSFEERIKFSDKRQATLLCFGPDSRAPLLVPIAFEECGIEPFNPTQGGYAFPPPRNEGQFPFWLNTSAGLIFSAPELGGHWLIPKAALESRLAAWRAKVRKESSQTSLPQTPHSSAGQTPRAH
jgi:hypothetical protein